MLFPTPEYLLTNRKASPRILWKFFEVGIDHRTVTLAASRISITTQAILPNVNLPGGIGDLIYPLHKVHPPSMLADTLPNVSIALADLSFCQVSNRRKTL